jgi:hypothetical protein
MRKKKEASPDVDSFWWFAVTLFAPCMEKRGLPS